MCAVNRFSPLALGPRVIAKNRVVVPAMASQTAAPDGTATNRTSEHYQRLAESGAGLVLVEYSYVHRSGRSEPNQLGADTDAHCVGLARIAHTIRAAESIPGLQLTHAGGKTERHYTDGSLLSPSGIAVPVKDRVLETPSVMTMADIRLWREAFVAAAERAAAAGFGLIELHAAHGYGLNQWLSPLTNTRTDAYGGSLEKRAALLLEIIAEIKARLPELVISVRAPGQDHLPGGLTTDEAIQTAILLQAAGVHVINVSSGLGGWRRPGERSGEGYLVAEAAAFRAALAVPVVGVGGIETAAYIERGLAAGWFTLAAVGRAILADPARWGARHLQPSSDEADARLSLLKTADGWRIVNKINGSAPNAW